MKTQSSHISPHALVRAVSLKDVRWNGGFWAARFETCRRHTIPDLLALMEGTEHTHFLQNFRIAAGLAEGRHRGAPFNDGDFYKLLEAACAALAIEPDAALEKRVEEAISIIGKAQRPDGYLQTKTLIRQTQPFTEPVDFELYNMGHLLTAACVHHQTTGRPHFLAIARKTADFLDNAFRNPTPELARFSICPSHYMGTLDLYRTTGELRYLHLAERFLALRDMVPTGGGSDDNQDRIPFRQQTEPIGHAVRANYLYAGAADLYAETGDATLHTPLEHIWPKVVQQKMAITGGCGALFDGASPDAAKDQATITRTHQAYGRPYQLPHQAAHNETCAAIGNLLWNWRMFLISGEARYLDVVELALYNSVLAGVSLEGSDFFYVNPLRRLGTAPCDLRWSHDRAPFFGSFCCPPNVARTVAEVGGYAYSVSEDALWVNLYNSSTLTTTLPGGHRVVLRQKTDYPWDGRIRLTFEEVDQALPLFVFALKLRIPGWAEHAAIQVNGEPVPGNSTPGTYTEIGRAWRKGDVVELNLPLPSQLMEAHPLVEEASGQVAVRRGPLIYCLESADLPQDISVTDILLPANLGLKPRFEPGFLGGITVLEGSAWARVSEKSPLENHPLYQPLRSRRIQSVDIRLIPYYTWGNRGPGEMSVWLPVQWQSS
jgi:DUF1680 family protein